MESEVKGRVGKRRGRVPGDVVNGAKCWARVMGERNGVGGLGEMGEMGICIGNQSGIDLEDRYLTL